MHRPHSPFNKFRSQVGSISQLIVRFRAVTIVLCIAITILATLGIRHLEFMGDNRSLFRSETTAFAHFEKLRNDFGTHKNDLVVLFECDDVFERDALNALHKIHSNSIALETVEDAMSIFTMRKRRRIGSYIPPILHPQLSDAKLAAARAEILEHPLAKGQFICQEGKVALIIMRLAGDHLTTAQVAGVSEKVQAIIDDAIAETECTASITGLPRLRIEIAAGVQRDLWRIGGIAAALAAIGACVLFRRLTVIVIVCLAPAMGAFWTLGYMGLVGEKLHVLNVIVPVMVLLIGFTDSVHLMFHLRREREGGAAPKRAAMSALREVGPACVLASLTNAIGFGALMMAQDELLQQFGQTAAIGALLSMVAVLTLVPVMASTSLGRFCTGSTNASLGHALSETIVGNLLAMPRAVAIVGVLATLALTYAGAHLSADFQFTENLPDTNEALQSLGRCDEALEGITPINVMVEMPAETKLNDPHIYKLLDDIHTAINDQDGVEYPVSLLTMLQTLPGRSQHPASRLRELRYLPEAKRAKFLNVETGTLRVIACVKDLPASQLLPICHGLDRRLDELASANPGYRFSMSGMSVISAQRIQQMIMDLTYSLGTAAILIFALMTLSFRSLSLGLITVIPNVFPLVATAALLFLLGEPLRYSGVVCFCISLGIAVDDTIHFLWRYRRQLKRTGDRQESVRRTFLTTSPVLVTTTLFMLMCFGAAMTSDLPTIRILGMTACASLTLALVGDLIILPAILVSDWNLASFRRPVEGHHVAEPSPSSASL